MRLRTRATIGWWGRMRQFWNVLRFAFLVLSPAVALAEDGTSHPVGAPVQWSKPVDAEQLQYTQNLDQLLAKHDYNALGAKILSPPAIKFVLPVLDWSRSRLQAGGSVIIPLLEARLTWAIAQSNPETSPLAKTAAMLTLYGLVTIMVDGVKCADASAPADHRFQVLLKYKDIMEYLGRLPANEREDIVKAALTLEERTAPLRQNDNYLCRFGMAEMQYSLKKHGNGTEVPSDPGTHGKTFVLENDLDYEPEYLPQDQWAQKQVEVRKSMPKIAEALASAFAPKSAK